MTHPENPGMAAAAESDTRSARFCTHWSAPLVAGLAHSTCLLLSQPPIGWWFFSLLSVMPLMWFGALRRERPWRDGLLVWLGAVPLWGIEQWWISGMTELGMVPLVLFMAAYPAAFVLCLRLVRAGFSRAPVFLVGAVLWTALEYLRGEIAFDGYPWGFACHPLIDAPFLASPARVGGVYLVSLLMGLLSAGALDAWRGKRALGVATILLWVIFHAACWHSRSPDPGAGSIRITVFQTNVPQSNKIDWTLEQEAADWRRYEDVLQPLTTIEPSKRPDLVVWPETMMPGLTLERSALNTLAQSDVVFRLKTPEGERALPATAFADALLDLQRRVGVPMLVGETALTDFAVKPAGQGVTFDWSRRYNSVYQISDGKIGDARYDKEQLTPFGEVMPYIHRWPWLQQKLLDFAATGMSFDLTPGTKDTVFTIPAPDAGGEVRLVTPICFEATFAPLCRRLVYGENARRRADVMLNVTNDGWFGKSEMGREQHLLIARWRCVELSTPMVRAANTGISAFIDADGRVFAAGVDGQTARANVDGLLTRNVTIPTRTTAYARVGDAAGWGSMSAAGLLLLASWASCLAERRANRAIPSGE